MWGAVTTASLPSTTDQAGISSVSPTWHYSAHHYPDNSNSMVDNEFDMLGTRSRSPMMFSTVSSNNQMSLGMLI